MERSEQIIREQAAWSAKDSLDFYERHRHRPDEMYPSERFFLPDAARAASSVLDIGCAAGGFSRIMKSFNPAIHYTGIDITPAFIEAAKRLYPDSEFELGDGIHFSTPPGSYDLVYISGILHVNSEYRRIVQAAYEQAKRQLICDFRLTWGSSVTGRFHVNFDQQAGEENQKTPLPYHVLSVDTLLSDLRSLNPPPAAIRLRGYYHKPADTAELPMKQLIVAFASLEKAPTGTGGTTVVTTDLPTEHND